MEADQESWQNVGTRHEGHNKGSWGHSNNRHRHSQRRSMVVVGSVVVGEVVQRVDDEQSCSHGGDGGRHVEVGKLVGEL